ncbi:MAG: hypothetical protein ACP5DZ_09985, partial [Bacteroidales bacterium]
FCNDKNVFIYFNTVYTKGFDLRELNCNELEKLVLYYKKSIDALPTTTYIQQRNLKFFKSITSQIQAWWQEKKEGYDRYLKTKNISREDLHALMAGKLYDNPIAQDKLVNIINTLPETLLLSEYQLQQLKQIRDDDFVREMEHNDLDTLNYMLNHFIEKQNFPNK